MNYAGFIGGSAAVRSLNANAERCINWFKEQTPGTPPAPAWLVPRPGLEAYVVFPNGPVRALFAQDGRAWGVSGTSLYEILGSANILLRGTTTADGRPATISSNGPHGHQLFITHGGNAYIYDTVTNLAVPVVTGAEPVEMGLFSDGYFLALKGNSGQVYYSSLFDGLLWDALDFFTVSTVGDKLVAIAERNREIWCFGSQTTSVRADVGDSDNPFQPLPGVKIDQGIIAPFSVVNLDNTLYWLGGNALGSRVVYRGRGYSPERISSHALEYFLNNYPRVDDAIAWTYQDEGHLFYVLYLPTPPDPNTPVIDHTTWTYDVATGDWHERAVWNSTTLRWEPHLGRCHCYAFGRHLVGDRQSGAVYSQRLDLAFDGQVVMGVG